jgi:probable F420-dependent oxidoreductase
MGYWGVCVPDHILSTDTDVAEHRLEEMWNWRFGDPLTVLAFLAASSTRLFVGPRILVGPYRQPFAVAHAIATIDSLSGGRAFVGIAAGYDEKEFRAMGIPRQERGPITDEHLEIMLKLWESEGPVSHRGRYHRFDDVQLHLPPVQRPHPRIWVGGNSRAGLRRAIRFGDAWTPTVYPYSWPSPSDGVDVMRDDLKDMLAEAAEQRAAMGRAPLECIVSAGMPLVFSESPQHRGRRPAEVQQFSGKGTAEEVAEEFVLFKEAGVTGFVIRLPGESLDAFLGTAETFMTAVLPLISSEVNAR